MIEVTVKTLDGKNRAFSVPDEITVKQFKKTIAASIEITADIQRLIFKGRILSDEKKINDYDVNGKTIHVVQKLPPVSTSSTSTTSSSTDPLPARTRDSDESGRSGRRIFLGSYALAPDGTNVMQQILDDLGETMNQGQRTQTQNQEDGLPSSSANNSAASQNRSSADTLSRINHIKKLIASAKRALELLDSPSTENDANLDDCEPTDPTEDHTSSAEQGTSSQSTTAEQDQDSQHPSASVLGDLLDEVMLINERLQPHVVLYQQLLRDQCVYRKKSRKLENAQRLSNLVPRTMHYVSHVYHNLSDLSVDVSTAPPRRIQAPSRRSATIIQQTIPVLQAEISLSGGPLANATDVQVNSTATTGGRAEPPLSAAAEVTEPESGSARSRSMLSRPRSQGSMASMAWTSAPGTSSLSSVFPLFFSSSLGSSLLPTSFPRASSTVATTSATPSASVVSTSSTSSTMVASTTSSTVVSGTTSSTTGASSRSGGRRGYRRFTEAARPRPSVNISSQEIGGDLVARHVDPYLACHSRHFRTNQSAQLSTSSTGRNSNSSLADMISNIVSSIMTTTGEAPADAPAGGRRGNEDDGPAAASFSTHFDSPTQALQMLDDPEMEEEVISSWHPLDDDGSFVRNIFGATERSSESARLDHQILNMMINRDNWLEGLLCCVLDCLSFTEVVTVLSGVLTPLTRLREPLQEFVTSTVLNGEEPTDDNLSRAVDHMMDDLFFCLEEIACDLEPLMDVDFASSLSSFLRYHLKKILGMIMKSTEESDFSVELCSLLQQLATELVCLCEGCLSRDGFITLIQQRLWHFLPFGVHSAIRNWTQVQLRHFQRSVLPSALQSVVYERHVVFTPQSDSANRPEASGTAEPQTKEAAKKTGKESNGASESSETKEENASTSQGPSGSSAVNLVVDESTKDRCRRGRKALPNHDDNLVDEVSIKRRRVSNCEGQNGGVEWTSFSVSDRQTDSDEARPSVAVTFSRDSPFEDGPAGSNLQNGLEPPAPTPFPDAEDLSSTKN